MVYVGSQNSLCASSTYIHVRQQYVYPYVKSLYSIARWVAVQNQGRACTHTPRLPLPYGLPPPSLLPTRPPPSLPPPSPPQVRSQKSEWALVKSFPDMPKRGVLSLKFGTDARTLFVGSADHNLRVFSVGAGAGAGGFLGGAANMQE